MSAVNGLHRAGLQHARTPRHALSARTAKPGPRVEQETHFDTDTGQITVMDYVGEGASPDGDPAVTVNRAPRTTGR